MGQSKEKGTPPATLTDSLASPPLSLSTSNHNHLQKVMAAAFFPPFKCHKMFSFMDITQTHARILGSISA